MIILTIIASIGFLDLPVFGWDVLDQWAPAASDYLRAHEWTWENYRSAHPATISALIAISEKHDLVGADIFSSQTLWLTVWAIILAVIFLHSQIVTGSAHVSLVLTMVAMTIPLFENHLLIHGYAEIFLALIIILTSALFIHITKTKLSIATTIILSGIALASLKNIGLILWIVITSAFFLAGHYEKHKLKINLVVLLGPASLVFILFVFDTYGLPLEVSMRYRESISIQPENLLLVPRNELYSLALNASFGIVPAALFFGTCFFFLGKHNEEGFWIAAFTFFGLFLFILLSQLTQYGFFYAVPERDTGNTRFTLYVILTGILMLPYVIVHAERRILG